MSGQEMKLIERQKILDVVLGVEFHREELEKIIREIRSEYSDDDLCKILDFERVKTALSLCKGMIDRATKYVLYKHCPACGSTNFDIKSLVGYFQIKCYQCHLETNINRI